MYLLYSSLLCRKLLTSSKCSLLNWLCMWAYLLTIKVCWLPASFAIDHPQDFERHEEERSDFLKDRFLKYIDICVEVHEACAEVSCMRTRLPHCYIPEQSTPYTNQPGKWLRVSQAYLYIYLLCPTECEWMNLLLGTDCRQHFPEELVVACRCLNNWQSSSY